MADAPAGTDLSQVMGNRGVLSSLGAGLSLVIAGVIVLVIVSGVVAFRGWPGMRSDGVADAVRLARVAAPPAGTIEPVVVGSATSARRSSAGASRGRPGGREAGRRGRRDATRRGASRGSGRAGGRSRDAGPGGGIAGGSGPGGSDAGGGGSGPESARRTPDPVSRALEGVGRTVDHVTEPKPPGSPPVDAPQVVRDTTQTADEVVEDTTQVVEDAAGGAVKGLLP